MVLAAMNSKETHLLCDLCVVDVSAKSRCMDCAISFCQECEEIHLRQKSSAEHEVLSLDRAREKGITKVRRRIMCLRHPDSELSLFCNTCCDVICSECITHCHQGHTFDKVSKAAESQMGYLKSAVYKTRHLINKSAKEVVRLTDASRDIEDRCNSIQEEVEQFMDGYIRAIEEHKQRLLERIRQFRNKKLDYLTEEKIKLQKKVRDARDLNYFLSDLLTDGVEAEILSFLKPVLRRFKNCETLKKIETHDLCSNLQFNSSEPVVLPNCKYKLYGDVTTHSVAPELCNLRIEGLKDARVGKITQVVLETRDENNSILEKCDEIVTADLLYKNGSDLQSRNLDIVDNKNGTFHISFIPECAGKYALQVKIHDQIIKDSPHTFVVQPANQHNGIYHCCSFCSSGGSKQADACACGGQMPGGYRGCGHGHEGHPGLRHWSCCGATGEYSECTRRHYQFTL